MNRLPAHILAMILLYLTVQLSAQSFTDDCILIDFESIPKGTLVEGLPISDQYSERYGVTFLLENGQAPILSEVGNPTTAFGGAFGGDTPAPGQNVGQFFLTDDGKLQGLSSIPLIVSFETPMDSVSGCILDIDFGEIFVIDARGEFGETIFRDTINANDPGTGDGLSTCWGFRLDECEGSIYSVRLQGSRIQSGAFGLGLDNFAFCKFGATINVDFQVNQKDIICGDESGSIEINTISNDILEYSLNGQPYIVDSVFPELPEGVYTLDVRNQFGCEDTYFISIDNIPEPEINGIISTDTECGVDNGTITVEVINGFAPYRYTFDGIEFQSSNVFTDLSPGSYSIFIVDALGCVDFSDAFIAPSEGPYFVSLDKDDTSCDLDNGTIQVGADSSFPTVEYSLDASDWQSFGEFDALAVGSHIIEVRDAQGCIIDTSIIIGKHTDIVLRDVVETTPECLLDNGTITIIHTGGFGMSQFSINGGLYQDSEVFTDLAPGTYQITIKDEKECELTFDAIVPPYRCPVFIGNIFAPNDNGYNDIFPVITADGYDAGIIRYSIYDRWGELIYDAQNFSIHDKSRYWDGMFNGQLGVLGVYVYLVEVAHLDGSTEFLSGDVTLIK